MKRDSELSGGLRCNPYERRDGNGTGRVENEVLIEMMKILFLVSSISTSEKIYVRAIGPKNSVRLPLDDLFLGFPAPTTLLLNYGVAKVVVKKAIVYLISWGAVIPIIGGHACACATRRIFFFSFLNLCAPIKQEDRPNPGKFSVGPFHP